MIRLSPGILASVHEILKHIKNYQINNLDRLLTGFQDIEGTKITDVLDTACKCKWINIIEKTIEITNNGMLYSKQFDIAIKRAMISDFINYVNPSWAMLIPRGRLESVSYMPLDVKACLKNTLLLEDPPSDITIIWWDNQASLIRGRNERKNLSCGRIGEKLTLLYEKTRVGKQAQWKSIESNILGYDILSFVDRDNDTYLPIEVKASENAIDHAIAHISRLEWDKALQSNNYLFYFWLLQDPYPKLAIIHPNDLKIHIPKDHGKGKWEGAEICFKLFEARFYTYQGCFEKL